MKFNEILMSAPSYIHSIIYDKPEDKKNVRLPKQIDDLTLVKDLQPKKGYPYGVGLYINDNHQLFIAKIWNGRRKTIHHYTLKYEIAVYKNLSAVQKRINKRKNTLQSRIQIPNFVSFVEGKNKLILVIEYVKAKTVPSTMISRNIIKKHAESQEYIRLLGRECTPRERKMMLTRGFGHYVLIYPIIFILACIKNPSFTLNLFRAGIIFLKNISSLHKENNSVLVHGDLHIQNILKHGKKLYVIDLEQTIFTFEDYELITTISSRRTSAEVRNLLLLQKMKDLEENPKKRDLFRALIILCSTHNLSGNLPDENAEICKNLIKFATQNKLFKSNYKIGNANINLKVNV